MQLREITQSLIEKVEKETGYQVHVVEDSSLNTFAAVKMARGSALFHTVLYNPKMVAESDYVICFQCCLVLRHFAVPTEQRKDFAAKGNAAHLVDEMLQNLQMTYLNMGMGKDALTQLKSQLLNGIMTQLRSVPVGLRADAWLWQEYPDLRNLQESSVGNEIKRNLEVLAPHIKQMVPKQIYDANVAMNAAQAMFWAGLLKDPKLGFPYENLYQKITTLKLMEVLKNIPDSPEHDRALIDGWAQILGFTEWYEWTDYKIMS